MSSFQNMTKYDKSSKLTCASLAIILKSLNLFIPVDTGYLKIHMQSNETICSHWQVFAVHSIFYIVIHSNFNLFLINKPTCTWKYNTTNTEQNHKCTGSHL